MKCNKRAHRVHINMGQNEIYHDDDDDECAVRARERNENQKLLLFLRDKINI